MHYYDRYQCQGKEPIRGRPPLGGLTMPPCPDPLHVHNNQQVVGPVARTPGLGPATGHHRTRLGILHSLPDYEVCSWPGAASRKSSGNLHMNRK